MHPTLRRIRQRKLRSGSFARLNEKDFSLYLVFTAPPFLKRRRLRNPGLKFEPLHNLGKLNLHLLAAPQRDTCIFSEDKAVPQLGCPEQPSSAAFFLKEEPAVERPERHGELLTRSGPNSVCFRVTLGKAPVTEARRKKSLTLVPVFFEPCFFRVARQPQQPVVEALKKI